MRNLMIGALLLIAGWLLGWYSQQLWRDEPVTPAVTASDMALVQTPPPDVVPKRAVAPDDLLRQLLLASDYTGAVDYYETLQRQADKTVVPRARQQLLGRAKELLEGRQYASAETLLQRLLVATWRDVEVRMLLAELDYRQGNGSAAIEQLYEARGHAWDTQNLVRLQLRIRELVNEQAAALGKRGDQTGLLEFYQRLTQLEPDHAPYFIGLAEVQLMLGDTDAAVQSLQLVAQDPDYGAQAETLLAQVQDGPVDQQQSVAVPAVEVAGIPLQRRGSHFLVEARPGRGGSLNLLIDTGASMTIVTPAALEHRGIRYTDTGRSGVFSTANGRVSAPIYRIDTLAVDAWEVRRIEVGVLDLGNRTDIDGLLGMNFLQHFQFFIDQNRSRLLLSLREPH